MALAVTPIMSHAAQVGFRDGNTGDYTAQPFLSESLTHLQEVLDGQGVSGARSDVESLDRLGVQRNGGTLTFIPNKTQLEAWLAHITGSAEVTHTWALAAALKQTLDVMVWKSNGGEDFGEGCVSKAVLSGSAGGLLQVALDLLFKNWTDASAAGTISARAAGIPYALSDVVLTINSQAILVKSFELTLDNMVDAEQYYSGATTVAQFDTQGRLCTLKFTAPYSAQNEQLVAYCNAATSGVLTDYAATLVATHPDAHTFTVTMGRLRVDSHTKNVGGREGDVELVVECKCLASSTGNDELAFAMSA